MKKVVVLKRASVVGRKMKTALSRAVVLTGLIGVVFVFTAFAEEVLFQSRVIGSNPNTPIGGVPSAPGPWIVQRGSAILESDGRLHVEVAGLILQALGTTGPVKSVSASLVCGGTGGSVVATTDAVPLSAAGDAEIESKISVPNTCFGPVILIRGVVGGNAGLWIAGTGFTPTSESNDNGDANNR